MYDLNFLYVGVGSRTPDVQSGLIMEMYNSLLVCSGVVNNFNSLILSRSLVFFILLKFFVLHQMMTENKGKGGVIYI